VSSSNRAKSPGKVRLGYRIVRFANDHEIRAQTLATREPRNCRYGTSASNLVSLDYGGAQAIPRG
jgi:hypothetical protein